MVIILCAVALLLVFLLMRKTADKEVEQNRHKKEVEKLETLRQYPYLNENYSIGKSICTRLAHIYQKGSNFGNDGDFKFHILQDSASSILAKGIISRFNHLEVSFVFPHKENYITLYLKLSTTYTYETFAQTQQKFYENKSENFILDFILDFVENNSKK